MKAKNHPVGGDKRSVKEDKQGKTRRQPDWDGVIGHHSAMMALEPRFMFDAAVAATADAVADNAAAQGAAAQGAPDAAQPDGAAGDGGDAAGQDDGAEAARFAFGNLDAGLGGGFMVMSGGYEPDNLAPIINGGDAPSRSTRTRPWP